MWVIFNNFFVFLYCNIICFPPLIFLFRIFIIIKVKSNFLCYANARRVGLADDPSLLCSFISYSICFHFSIISPPVLHLEELAWWDFNFLVVWKFFSFFLVWGYIIFRRKKSGLLISMRHEIATATVSEKGLFLLLQF